MKKYIYIPLLLLLSLAISSCQSSATPQLDATNQALASQVNSLIAQLTQQAALPEQKTQEPISASTQIIPPTEAPPPSPSPIPATETSPIAPTLIVSGAGEITPWSNQTAYPIGLFGAANVHLVCDTNDTTDGKVWIDDKSYSVSCSPNSESWYPWKQEISVGDHYIYSANASDKYEFWTPGTTPFTIRNKYSHSDYMFQIKDPGIYDLTANVVKGKFNLYLTCEGAQNFNYPIAQSTTIQLVLNPGRCELLVRDSPPGTVTPGEIEVSLAKAK